MAKSFDAAMGVVRDIPRPKDLRTSGKVQMVGNKPFLVPLEARLP
jgi:hypothetical protein